MSTDRIGTLLDRPKSYYNIDGVGELGIGFMCLSFALLQWMQIHTPEHSAWNQMYTLFLYFGLMSSIIHYGSKAVKKHITYPRTGFVEYRTRDTVWRPLIIGFAVSMLASFALIIAIRSHWNMTALAPLLFLVVAACYAHGIARTVRWKWVVAGAMSIGSLVIAILPADMVGALANHSWVAAKFPARLVGAYFLCMALYGALTLISGGISFWLYLRNTQAPAQESL
jgi:hypothetical protein